MARKYAAGREAWGECGRCGKRDLLKALVFDGYYPNMRVCSECYEPKHPQENLKRIDDPVALWRPSPENLNSATAFTVSGNLLSVSNIQLIWTESEQDVSQVDLYRIYRSVDGGPFEFLATYTVERDMFGGRTSELEYQDTDVTFGQHTYQYYLVAHPIEGGETTSNVLDLSDIHAAFLDIYESDATWVKRAGVVWVDVVILGSGGGGGGGGITVGGGIPGGGGAGGGGGGYSFASFPAAILSDSVAVTVPQGFGGAQKAYVFASNVTVGNPGVTPAAAAFGAYLRANGGGGGGGGGSGVGANAEAGSGLDFTGGVGFGSSGNTIPDFGGAGGARGGGTGGSGGPAPGSPDQGGYSLFIEATSLVRGVSGTGTSLNGTDGGNVNALLPGGGGGGGGSFAIGGVGGRGSGGGGGGGADSGDFSRAGRDGGSGFVAVISYI